MASLKMKYHKIRSVPMEVCTAEQKIAYNLAFLAHISFQDKFDKAKEEKVFNTVLSDFIHEIADFEMKRYRCSDTYKPGKYNEDAIQCALLWGLRGYFENPFIATSYSEIGKVFAANYL